jgi:hypothetical protein
MIHYSRTPMAAETEWQTDEARFLDDPAAVLAGWNDAVRDVAAAVGLDYFGIDCAQLPDGRLVVFEADAAMLVHGLDPGGPGIRAHPARAARVARRASRRRATFAGRPSSLLTRWDVRQIWCSTRRNGVRIARACARS